MIDSGVISHITSDISKFESLDTIVYGKLNTASNSLSIKRKEIILDRMSDSLPFRLAGVLYVSRAQENLFLTQMLKHNGIFNSHLKTRYEFFKQARKSGEKKIIAKKKDISLTSYLQ